MTYWQPSRPPTQWDLTGCAGVGLKRYEIDGKIVNAFVPNQIEYRKLEIFYDTCNELFKSCPECFYTTEQLDQLKRDPANKFIRGNND